MLDFGLAQSAFSNGIPVEIDVRMEVGLDQFFANAETFLEICVTRSLVPFVGSDVISRDTKFIQLSRHVRASMVSGQNDERILQTNSFVDEVEKLRKSAVQAQHARYGRTLSEFDVMK